VTNAEPIAGRYNLAALVSKNSGQPSLLGCPLTI
jgi:hypothetical protein